MSKSFSVKSVALWCAVSVLAFTGTVRADTISRILGSARDIAYDPASQKLYGLLVDSSTGASRVVAVNPDALVPGMSLEVGYKAGKLALSRDGKFLYVASHDSTAVQKIDLTAQTVGAPVFLGSHSLRGVYRVWDMEVLPDNSSAVAIHRATALTVTHDPSVPMRPEEVVVYDGATQRVGSTSITSSNYYGGIEFGGSSSRLYGVGGNGAGGAVVRLDVTNMGVAHVDRSVYIVNSEGLDLKYHAGRLYMPGGDVIDAESRVALGRYPGVEWNYVRVVCPDSASGRVFILMTRNGKTILRAYDMNRFVSIGELEIPGAVLNNNTRLVRHGADSLIFNAGDVFKVSTSLVTAPPAPVPAPTPVAVAPNVWRLDLMTRDMIYEAGTGRLYVSVYGGVPGLGNTLTALDPRTLTVGVSTWVGSEPGKLAKSDNGQYIYAAINNGAAVRRFDVATQTAGLQFNLGRYENPSHQYPVYFVEDMEVAPGQPGVVAIARRFAYATPAHAWVAIYDEGAQRPVESGSFNGGPNVASNAIEFSSSPSRLYGLSKQLSTSTFNRMDVGATGVSPQSQVFGLANTWDDIRFDSGRVYTASGTVIDPVAGVKLGKFEGVPFGATVCPDTANGRVFFLGYADNIESGYRIDAFDSNTFAKLGTMAIPPGANGVSGTPMSLVRWGGDGLAFITSVSEVFTLRWSLVGLDRSLTVAINNPTISETAGPAAATGTVTRYSGLDTPLTVTITSSDTSEVRVPATVTIPAGDASVEFAIAAVDDTLADGPINASVTATVPEYLDGRAALTVIDNESRELRGRVTNHSGQGIPGIIVKRNGSANAVTNAEGEFLFRIVAPGTHSIAPYLTTGLVGTAFAPASRSVVMGTSDVAGIDFTATFAVRGNVLNSNGTGMPNVLVARRQGNTVFRVATDAAGQYEFRGVRDGVYQIALEPTPAINGFTFTPPTREVTVTTTNLSTNNFFAMFSISGNVANNHGVPIPNVQITRRAGSSAVTTVTDANGNYRFSDVRSGNYTLEVNPTPAMAGMSLSPALRSLTVVSNNLTNQNFNAWFSISGRVTDSGTGLGLANVEVKREQGLSTVRAFTDAQGNYQFRDVRSGSYSITPVLRGSSFVPASRNVTVGTGSTTGVNFLR